MANKCIINKGISKVIKAVGRRFTIGETYIAAIYNPKDLTVKIMAAGICVSWNEHNVVSFTFAGEDTDKLKVGYATIEIYDSEKNMMVYRDNFATIRKNSLPISGDEPEPPTPPTPEEEYIELVWSATGEQDPFCEDKQFVFWFRHSDYSIWKADSTRVVAYEGYYPAVGDDIKQVSNPSTIYDDKPTDYNHIVGTAGYEVSNTNVTVS